MRNETSGSHPTDQPVEFPGYFCHIGKWARCGGYQVLPDCDYQSSLQLR